MLRKRSRTVSSGKQTPACDQNSTNRNTNPSPNSEKSHKPTSSFLFNTPRNFKDFFLSRDQPTPTSIMSPSSVLDTKPFSSALPTSPPLWIETQTQNPKTFSWEKPGIGLALIDYKGDEKNPQMGTTNKGKSSKQRSKLVVFGSHLNIQIPPTSLHPPTSPQSPMEFGIKTPKSNLLGHVFAKSVHQQKDDYYYTDKKKLSVEDMELSEDYTCVISHGPNPKTTHIFGNCIVKSCCAAISNTVSASASSSICTIDTQDYSFLSFCHHCNKRIGLGKDIYIYRGEKAFCSQECRSQEMLSEGIEC